jgi:CTP-dependent riboflavin kinase
MDVKKRIEELEEHHRLIIMDLRNLEILERKIGKTSHQEEITNKFLDQLHEVMKELKELKKSTNQLLPAKRGSKKL